MTTFQIHRTDRPSIGIDRSFRQTRWTDCPSISISSIDRSPDRPSISSIGIDDRLSIPSIGIDDRLSIPSIGGRVFSILAYFSQSCPTRCDGRSDRSSVCQWTSTDRHSKRSYSIRPGCILKGVRIEEGYLHNQSTNEGNETAWSPNFIKT